MTARTTLALLGAALAFGAQDGRSADALSTRPGWDLGLQAARYHYEEPDFMRLEGNRGGLSAAYTEVEERRFGKLEGRYSYGKLKYEGTGTQNGVPDHIFETRALAGADYHAGSVMSVSPFIGLGYRYLYNDLRGYDTVGGVTYFGYRRYSQYLYAPVGITARFAIGAGWALVPTVEYDYFIRGRQKSKLTDTGIPGLVDITNEQKHGRGYRASLTVEAGHLAFGPWVNYWRIKDSEVSAGFFEPANRTREAGVEVRYRF